MFDDRIHRSKSAVIQPVKDMLKKAILEKHIQYNVYDEKIIHFRMSFENVKKTSNNGE